VVITGVQVGVVIVLVWLVPEQVEVQWISKYTHKGCSRCNPTVLDKLPIFSNYTSCSLNMFRNLMKLTGQSMLYYRLKQGTQICLIVRRNL
jgi:hypothetical protein